MPASEQVITRRAHTDATGSVAETPPRMVTAAARTVLVVDSDSAARATTLECLRGAGYRASGVDTFHAARPLLVSLQPDALIADVQLGAFNGLHLVMLRRAEHPEATSVVTHASSDPVLQREALQFDAPYLVKPVRPEVLLDTLAARLAGSDGTVSACQRTSPIAADIAFSRCTT